MTVFYTLHRTKLIVILRYNDNMNIYKSILENSCKKTTTNKKLYLTKKNILKCQYITVQIYNSCTKVSLKPKKNIHHTKFIFYLILGNQFIHTTFEKLVNTNKLDIFDEYSVFSGTNKVICISK
jgi:hypothetical protein